MNRTLTVVMVTAVALIGVQVAWAAIPNANGHIVSCYKTSGGAMRVVNATKDCDSATEKSLVFTQAAVPFDVDVAATDSTALTQMAKKFGVTVSYNCHTLTGYLDPTLAIDPGTSGITNGTYTRVISDWDPQVRPQQIGLNGPGAIHEPDPFLRDGFEPSGWLRDEGTLLVKTASGYATITFHMVSNWDTQRCQFRG